MNYMRIHDAIIDRARTRKRPDCYCERHHVIPKSLGGSDRAENLVWLTGREHYLVHWLLFKIHRNKQTVFAWYRMTAAKNTVGRYRSFTFEYAKRAKAEATGAAFRGKRLSEEHRQKLSLAKKGRSYADMGRGTVSPLRGRSITEEHKRRVGEAVKGRRASAETRAKISAARTGERNPMFGRVVSQETRAKLSEAGKAYRTKLRELKARSEE